MSAFVCLRCSSFVRDVIQILRQATGVQWIIREESRTCDWMPKPHWKLWDLTFGFLVIDVQKCNEQFSVLQKWHKQVQSQPIQPPDLRLGHHYNTRIWISQDMKRCCCEKPTTCFTWWLDCHQFCMILVLQWNLLIVHLRRDGQAIEAVVSDLQAAENSFIVQHILKAHFNSSK